MAIAHSRPKPLRGGLGSSSTQPLIPSPNKIQPRPLVALDTETTGVDFWHGCRPFFVSTIAESGNIRCWEWDVDPYTREVIVPVVDTMAITKLVKESDLVLHNTKFDIRALETIGAPLPNWQSLHDTLIASHVLLSNESHKLKDLALQYLDIRDDDQKALQDATNAARRMARSLGFRLADEGDPHFPAQKRPKEGWWVIDTWLPRACAQYQWDQYLEAAEAVVPLTTSPKKRPSRANPPAPKLNDEWRPPGHRGPNDPGHPWWTVLKTYATRDVERTMGLWWMFKHELEEQGLWEFYEEGRQNLEPIYMMEREGATISVPGMNDMDKRLNKDAAKYQRRCIQLVKKTGMTVDEKTLGSSKQLQMVLFQNWKLKPGKRTPTGAGYSTDAETLNKLLTRSEGDAHEFIDSLLKMRRNDTALSHTKEYRLRATPTDYRLGVSRLRPTLDREDGAAELGSPNPPRRTKGGIASSQQRLLEFITLHFNFNPTGTDTTRLSSSQPNGQNISKKVILDDDGNVVEDYNIRKIFGPMPGREWYSIDYSNIELRIFAYQCGDEKLIGAFEQGFKVHCVFAEVLWQKEWKQCRDEALKLAPTKLGKGYSEMALWGLTADIFKVKYESTLYQWTKNGNFALIYGAGRERAASTYHHPDAFDLIRTKLPLIDDFLSEKDRLAKAYGYIRCLGGTRPPLARKGEYYGYRLYVPPTEPHVAVNYFIQGSAGWCMKRAINRCHRYLSEVNKNLVAAAPRHLITNGGPDRSRVLDQLAHSEWNPTYKMIMTIHDEIVFDFPTHERNKDIITKVARLMEQSGEDIGVPTPVEVERHIDNWAEGERIKL